MWEQELLLSLPREGGWSHSWQSLNTLIGPGMAEILIARSQWPRRHSIPGRGTVTSACHGDEEDRSEGHPGNALVSTQDGWGNQSPEKRRDFSPASHWQHPYLNPSLQIPEPCFVIWIATDEIHAECPVWKHKQSGPSRGHQSLVSL